MLAAAAIKEEGRESFMVGRRDGVPGTGGGPPTAVIGIHYFSSLSFSLVVPGWWWWWALKRYRISITAGSPHHYYVLLLH